MASTQPSLLLLFYYFYRFMIKKFEVVSDSNVVNFGEIFYILELEFEGWQSYHGDSEAFLLVNPAQFTTYKFGPKSKKGQGKWHSNLWIGQTSYGDCGNTTVTHIYLLHIYPLTPTIYMILWYVNHNKLIWHTGCLKKGSHRSHPFSTTTLSLVSSV